MGGVTRLRPRPLPARLLRPRAAEGRARLCIPILGGALHRAERRLAGAGGRSAEARPWPPPAPRAPPCCSPSATPCSCPLIRYRRPGRRALAAPAGRRATRVGAGAGARCARRPAGRGHAAGLVPSPVAPAGASVPTQPLIAALGGGGRRRRLDNSLLGRARQTCACACCRCRATGRRTRESRGQWTPGRLWVIGSGKLRMVWVLNA